MHKHVHIVQMQLCFESYFGKFAVLSHTVSVITLQVFLLHYDVLWKQLSYTILAMVIQLYFTFQFTCTWVHMHTYVHMQVSAYMHRYGAHWVVLVYTLTPQMMIIQYFTFQICV